MREQTPFVTVIMPIRNEEKYIARSLGAVLAQEYPADRLQVVVVDGTSSDGTRAAIDRVLASAPAGLDVDVLTNPGRIVSRGFNLGLSRARGDVIVRVDGHTEIASDYVFQCVVALQRTGAANVGGRMTPIGRGLIGEAVGLATTSPFGVGWSRFHFSQQEEWVDTVYMGAWPRKVFDVTGGLDEQLMLNEDDEFNNRLRSYRPAVGLFDEELLRNQDDEFSYRLRSRGGRILLCPSIHSSYINRSHLKDVWRQYFGYGLWKVRVLQKHPLEMSTRQFVPPTFVATVILLSFWALFLPGARLLLAALLASYLIADVTASLWRARHHGARHMLALLVIFPVLHASYGLGFLAGLLRFRKQWGRRFGTERDISIPLSIHGES
jgi:glycosyltransferase involved in cell wall biosynthesis